MVKVVTGDEIGLIKLIDTASKSLLATFGSSNKGRERGVVALSWAGTSPPLTHYCLF